MPTNKLLIATLLASAVATQRPSRAFGDSPPGPPPIDQTSLSLALARGEPIHRRTIAARQILAALHNQPRGAAVTRIEIIDSTITGDLTLDTDFAIPLIIRNSAVRQRLLLSGISSAPSVDLSESSFDEPVAFKRCTLASLAATKAVFHQPFSISDSTIGKSLEMANVTFERSCLFRGVKIGSRSNFTGTEFRQDARFSAEFHGMTFSNAVFRKAAVFDGSQFSGRGSSDFYETEFDELASFRGVTPRPFLRFDTTRFYGDFSLSTQPAGTADPSEVDFQNVLWRNRADFNGTEMSKLRLTEHCTLEKQLTLKYSKIANLFIEDSGIDGDADLIGSVFTNIGLLDTRFGGNVDFRDAQWARLTLAQGRFAKGLSLIGACRGCRDFLGIEADNSETWRSVAEAAERGGDQASANQAFFKEQRARRHEGRANRFFSWLSEWGWGFGVRPLRVLFWCGVVFLVFLAFYAKQAAASEEFHGSLERCLERIESAILFCAVTAYRPPFASIRAARAHDSAFRDKVTPAFKAMVWSEAIVTKILLLVLLVTLGKSSATLKEILGKLLPE